MLYRRLPAPPARAGRRAAMVATLCFCLTGSAAACVYDVIPIVPKNPAQFIFPNWYRYEAVDFGIVICNDPDPACPGVDNFSITGVTLFNYGTANGTTDITAIYLCFACENKTEHACNPAYTMTYAGVWSVGAKNYPAWTWVPASLPNVVDYDPCTPWDGSCNCMPIMRTFINTGPCPTAGATVQLGPGYNPIVNPAWPGGITDGWGCAAPWEETFSAAGTPIIYSFKRVDRDEVVPGDTLTYSIFYGKPGSPSVGPITILDTLPEYVTYVPGSAVPPAEPGWDPDVGPPLRLRWTIPGPLTSAGGATATVTFKVTVDWGNGNAFEQGSGDIAAPEGAFLKNQAAASFGGTACPVTSYQTNPVSTVVGRFLFWKLADNDMLFSTLPGQPADEITYTIYLRNVSNSRTWWDCVIWDTVPATLNPWEVNCGIYDPCVGWTMTPTGCAAGSPGAVVSGPTTILTWRFDLAPDATLTVKWKAIVKPSAEPGNVALNRTSIISEGRPGILGGSGSSVFPKNFTHLSRIELPTMYLSYVAFAAGADVKGGCPGFFLAFFPLNKRTQFELRAIQYQGAGWATTGGVSNSIGCLLGSCSGGYPGNATCGLGSGAIPGGGNPGCGAERTPSRYNPAGWISKCPVYPAHFIYKLTSNSPVVWQLLSHQALAEEDNHTYAPATTISFTGMQHYFWRRANAEAGAGYGDSVSLISTGLDPFGAYDSSLPTVVHMFKFNFVSLSWDYMRTYQLGGESQVYDVSTSAGDVGAWMVVSSDTQMIVEHGHNIASTLDCCCTWCADNFAGFMPTRETGNVVSRPGQQAHFYGIVAGNPEPFKVIIGNVGAAGSDANYEVWRYLPDDPVQVGMIPSNLNGTTGTYISVGSGTVPAGIANPANPAIFDTDGPSFNAPSTALFKVKLTSGGPIQVLAGCRVYQTYAGGAVIHAASGNQTGTEFWLHDAASTNFACGNKSIGETYTVDVFCPKAGMVVRGQSEDGYLATYTTSGPDQCVSFVALTNPVLKRNYRFDQIDGTGAVVITQFIQCTITEKGYTAPFVQTGTHYRIYTPPSVFIGQDFWITIVVIEASATKTDYCGTTSFTSTDPAATIQGAGMGTYLFAWSSSLSCTAAPDEDGVKLFVNLTMNQLGLQTLVATDVMDGSITGLGAVMVVGADVKLFKEPRLGIAASGDTMQFRICWSNYSSASARSFTITDPLPQGTVYVPEDVTALNCGNTKGSAVAVAYSSSTSATMPASFTTVPSGPLPASTRWLRWTVTEVGVRTTGCACFRLRVD